MSNDEAMRSDVTPQAVFSPLTRAAIFLATIDTRGESRVRHVLPEERGRGRSLAAALVPGPPLS